MSSPISASAHEPSSLLRQVAESNTFDSEWPDLQQQLVSALYRVCLEWIATQEYRNRSDGGTESKPALRDNRSDTANPLVAVSGSSPTPPPITSPTSPSSNSLLSPTSSPSRAAPAGESPSGSQQDREALDPPSTVGGLVLPAFPPLNPNRQRRSGSAPSPGPSIASVRVNGHPPVPVRGNVFEDEWDEDVVIGGKTMPSTLEEQAAKAEAQRLVAMLEDFDYPPFTIQRLAELLDNPTRYHTSMGKYFRAIERVLLVTTPWEAPSYIPVPVNAFAVPPAVEASGSIGGDIVATMPPRSVTPMFSPIPFAPVHVFSIRGDEPHTDEDAGDHGLMSPLTLGSDVERHENGEHANGQVYSNGNGTHEDEDDDAEGDVEVDDTIEEIIESENGNGNGSGNGMDIDADADEEGDARDDRTRNDQARSPTPEPERRDSGGSARNSTNTYIDSPRPIGRSPGQMSISSNTHSTSASNALASATASSSSSSVPTDHPNDPGHQPYLGRVDELDTGPLEATPLHTLHDDQAAGAGAGAGGGGGGEGGNMTPHGMSERPVPISSTTTVPSEERRVAGLPRSRSSMSLSERFVGASEEDKDKGQGQE